MYQNLSEQIYEQLLKMIVEKQYKPGERMPTEMALCENFGVSRNTLRSAINKLNALGFVETRQGGGTYVKAVDSDVYLNFFIPATMTHNLDILEILQFRKGIEVEAASLAAKNATEQDIKTLQLLLDMSNNDATDLNVLAIENMDFHEAVAAASHNKMFIKMMEIVKAMTLPEMKNFLLAQGSDIDSRFYHSIILQCIISKKPTEAAFFMDRHLTLLIERIDAYVSPEI